MVTITIKLRNVDEKSTQDVLDFVLRRLEQEGMKSQIVSTEIEDDTPLLRGHNLAPRMN